MPELVLVSGYPASGKTTAVKEFTDQGYTRLNADKEGGGRVDNLLPDTRRALEAGMNVVADNLFITIPSRVPWIETARKANAQVRIVHMDTSFEDCQLNACLRQIERTGKLLMPDDFKATKDPNLFPPAVLFVNRGHYENKPPKKNESPPIPDHPGKQTPKKSHGFDSVEIRKFKRVWPADHVKSAVILDADDTIRISTGAENWPLDPSEVAVHPKLDKVKAKIKELNPDHILGCSNQSTHEKKEYKTPLDVIEACFKRTNEITGIKVEEWAYCPHYRFPVQCYCRKPHAGLGAHLIMKYKLHPSKVTMIGDSTSDSTWAKRCGFNFIHMKDIR